MNLFIMGALFTAGAMVSYGVLNGLARAALNHLSLGLDDSDAGPAERSGMTIHTDHKTGLQYVSTVKGGLHPRLTATGEHMRVGR